MSKKPVLFDKQCPKCSAMGEVATNRDGILWFECFNCGFQGAWKTVSRLYKANNA